ncbi:hypothetical protein PMAYCL1PPCAC_08068, partial [Pristionchus mayeri]
GYAMKKSTFDILVDTLEFYNIIELEDVFLTGIAAQNIVSFIIDEGIASFTYTDYSDCYEYGPVLSFLNTHNQIDSTKSN